MEPNSKGTNHNTHINGNNKRVNNNHKQLRKQNWNQNQIRNWKKPSESGQWHTQDHSKVKANQAQWASCWQHTLELKSHWFGALNHRDSNHSSNLSLKNSTRSSTSYPIHQSDTRPTPWLHWTTNTSHKPSPTKTFIFSFSLCLKAGPRECFTNPNTNLEYHHAELIHSNASSNSCNIIKAGFMFFKHPTITNRFFLSQKTLKKTIPTNSLW